MGNDQGPRQVAAVDVETLRKFRERFSPELERLATLGGNFFGYANLQFRSSCPSGEQVGYGNKAQSG